VTHKFNFPSVYLGCNWKCKFSHEQREWKFNPWIILLLMSNLRFRNVLYVFLSSQWNLLIPQHSYQNLLQ